MRMDSKGNITAAERECDMGNESLVDRICCEIQLKGSKVLAEVFYRVPFST